VCRELTLVTHNGQATRAMAKRKQVVRLEDSAVLVNDCNVKPQVAAQLGSSRAFHPLTCGGEAARNLAGAGKRADNDAHVADQVLDHCTNDTGRGGKGTPSTHAEAVEELLRRPSAVTNERHVTLAPGGANSSQAAQMRNIRRVARDSG
jgi:nucleoid-associated protein YgaU